MDQSPKKVQNFSAALHFPNGAAASMVVSSAEAVVYYREVESFTLDDKSRPVERVLERTITWTTREPWVAPEERGEAIAP